MSQSVPTWARARHRTYIRLSVGYMDARAADAKARRYPSESLAQDEHLTVDVIGQPFGATFSFLHDLAWLVDEDRRTGSLGVRQDKDSFRIHLF